MMAHRIRSAHKDGQPQIPFVPYHRSPCLAVPHHRWLSARWRANCAWRQPAHVSASITPPARRPYASPAGPPKVRKFWPDQCCAGKYACRQRRLPPMDASSHCNETTAMSTNTRCVIAIPSPSHCQAHSAPRRDVNRPHLSDFRLCRMYSLATAGAFHPADQTMHPQHRRWPEMSHNPRPPAAGQTCNSGQTCYSG